MPVNNRYSIIDGKIVYWDSLTDLPFKFPDYNNLPDNNCVAFTNPIISTRKDAEDWGKYYEIKMPGFWKRVLWIVLDRLRINWW